MVTRDAEGNLLNRQRTPEEMERLRQLVREAIGFSGDRGDSISVVNSAFLAPEPVADLPEPPMWEQAWFWDIVKQVGGVLLVLILIFAVLRPTLKRLTATHVESAGDATALANTSDTGAPQVQGPLGADAQVQMNPDGTPLLGSDGEPVQLPGGGKYENIMDAARQLVDEDPKRVAQLVKSWIGEEAA